MKKVLNALWGIWCAIGCFCSPIWLTLILVNISGVIYELDYSMDEGTAGIIGVVLLVLWILAVLLPVYFYIKMNKEHKVWLLLIIILPLLLCMGIFGLNMNNFLFS